MKQLIIMLTVIVSFTSCKKENIQPNEPTPLPVVITEPFVNGTWNLLGYDGVENGTTLPFTTLQGVVELTYGSTTITMLGTTYPCVWNSETEAIVDGFTWTFEEGSNNQMRIWSTNPGSTDYLVLLLERQ